MSLSAFLTSSIADEQLYMCVTASNKAHGKQVQQKASADHAALQAETQTALQAKDAEVQGLLADRRRLEAALASIKGQITSAASPARLTPEPVHSRISARTPVDSQTLRCNCQALYWL